MSSKAEPLTLKQFIYELDVPVIARRVRHLHGRAPPDAQRAAPGVLSASRPGPRHTTRNVLGVAVPIATAISDVAARAPRLPRRVGPGRYRPT
ncbi:hypothetical protein GCM10020219_017800 [Nonomuraea dietziae]